MRSKVTRVTVTLPREMLEAADETLVEPDESRSGMIRRLIKTALREAQDRKDVEQWIRAYREQPQTEEEVGWFELAALETLRDLPWE
jgi:metal-responsive CopG/Arc/MetJ family transcriptional regulator